MGLFGVILLGACTSDKDSHETGESASGADPCSDGWGAISDAAASIHVRIDGDDAADGSADAPLATVAEALDRTRARGGLRRIAIGPGTFPANLLLHAETGFDDDGLVIEGCAAGETVLDGSTDARAVLSASGVGVLVAGVTLQGGYRGAVFWSGGESHLTDVVIAGAARSGILAEGTETVVQAERVSIEDVVPEDSVGYGIVAQYEATVALTDVDVARSTRVGVLADGAFLTMTGGSVTATATDADGLFGRGVQLQDYAELTASGVAIVDNTDAGLLSIGSTALSLSDLTVDGTLPGRVTAGVEPDTGDGIVLLAGEEESLDYSATLAENIVTYSARAGIVVEVPTTFSGNDADATNGAATESGSAVYYQDVDSSEIVVEDGTVEAATRSFTFNRAMIALEAP